MAKYTGTDMKATFGTKTFNCLTSIEYSGAADVLTGTCAGSTGKFRVVSATDHTFTLNYMLDTTTYAEFKDLPPGTTGTFTASINGTYGPGFSCAAIVQAATLSSPADGFVAGTLTVGSDGTLTIS